MVTEAKKIIYTKLTLTVDIKVDKEGLIILKTCLGKQVVSYLFQQFDMMV